MTKSLQWPIVGVLVAVVVAAGVPFVLGWTSADPQPVDQGERERDVTIDEVPEAVRATILREAGDNEIEEIEEETKNGVTTYEAEWHEGGKEVEIEVAADGTLLEKEIEDDDDEGDAGDDDEDDDDEDDDN